VIQVEQLIDIAKFLEVDRARQKRSVVKNRELFERGIFINY